MAAEPDTAFTQDGTIPLQEGSGAGATIEADVGFELLLLLQK